MRKEQTKRNEFDLDELVKGNVDDITPKLAEMPRTALDGLRALEQAKGEEARSTLIAAIDAEGDTRERVDAAVAMEHERVAAKMETLGYPRNGGPEDADAIDKALMALAGVQADRDQLREDLAQSQKAGAELAATIEALNASAGATQAETPPAKALKLSAKRDPASLSAAEGPSDIVLVDGDDVPLPGLTPRGFVPGDFTLAGSAAVLARDVPFPVHSPRGDVRGAFLMRDGKPVAKAELVAPFAIGGGHQAKLPAGTLRFE